MRNTKNKKIKILLLKAGVSLPFVISLAATSCDKKDLNTPNIVLPNNTNKNQNQEIKSHLNEELKKITVTWNEKYNRSDILASEVKSDNFVDNADINKNYKIQYFFTPNDDIGSLELTYYLSQALNSEWINSDKKVINFDNFKTNTDVANFDIEKVSFVITKPNLKKTILASVFKLDQSNYRFDNFDDDKYIIEKVFKQNDDEGELIVTYNLALKKNLNIKSRSVTIKKNGFLTTLEDQRNKESSRLNEVLKTIHNLTLKDNVDLATIQARDLKDYINTFKKDFNDYEILFLSKKDEDNEKGQAYITIQLKSKRFPEKKSSQIVDILVQGFKTNEDVRKEIRAKLNAKFDSLQFVSSSPGTQKDGLPSSLDLTNFNLVKLQNTNSLANNQNVEIKSLEADDENGQIKVKYVVKEDDLKVGEVASGSHEAVVAGYLNNLEKSRRDELARLENLINSINILEKKPNASSKLPQDINNDDFNLDKVDYSIIILDSNRLNNNKDGNLSLEIKLKSKKYSDITSTSSKILNLSGFLTTSQDKANKSKILKEELKKLLKNITFDVNSSVNKKTKLPSQINSNHIVTIIQPTLKANQHVEITNKEPKDKSGELTIVYKIIENDSYLGSVESETNSFVISGFMTKEQNEINQEKQRLNSLLNNVNDLILKTKAKEQNRPSTIDFSKDYNLDLSEAKIVIDSSFAPIKNDDSGTIKVKVYIKTTKAEAHLQDLKTEAKSLTLNGYQTTNAFINAERAKYKAELNNSVDNLTIELPNGTRPKDHRPSFFNDISKLSVQGKNADEKIIVAFRYDDDKGELIVKVQTSKEYPNNVGVVESDVRPIPISGLKTTEKFNKEQEIIRLNSLRDNTTAINLLNSLTKSDIRPKDLQLANLESSSVQAHYEFNIISRDDDNGSVVVSFQLVTDKIDPNYLQGLKSTGAAKELTISGLKTTSAWKAEIRNNEIQKLNQQIIDEESKVSFDVATKSNLPEEYSEDDVQTNVAGNLSNNAKVKLIQAIPNNDDGKLVITFALTLHNEEINEDIVSTKTFEKDITGFKTTKQKEIEETIQKLNSAVDSKNTFDLVNTKVKAKTRAKEVDKNDFIVEHSSDNKIIYEITISSKDDANGVITITFKAKSQNFPSEKSYLNDLSSDVKDKTVEVSDFLKFEDWKNQQIEAFRLFLNSKIKQKDFAEQFAFDVDSTITDKKATLPEEAKNNIINTTKPAGYNAHIVNKTPNNNGGELDVEFKIGKNLNVNNGEINQEIQSSETSHYTVPGFQNQHQRDVELRSKYLNDILNKFQKVPYQIYNLSTKNKIIDDIETSDFQFSADANNLLFNKFDKDSDIDKDKTAFKITKRDTNAGIIEYSVVLQSKSIPEAKSDPVIFTLTNLTTNEKLELNKKIKAYNPAIKGNFDINVYDKKTFDGNFFANKKTILELFELNNKPANTDVEFTDYTYSENSNNSVSLEYKFILKSTINQTIFSDEETGSVDISSQIWNNYILQAKKNIDINIKRDKAEYSVIKKASELTDDAKIKDWVNVSINKDFSSTLDYVFENISGDDQTGILNFDLKIIKRANGTSYSGIKSSQQVQGFYTPEKFAEYKKEEQAEKDKLDQLVDTLIIKTIIYNGKEITPSNVLITDFEDRYFKEDYVDKQVRFVLDPNTPTIKDEFNGVVTFKYKLKSLNTKFPNVESKLSPLTKLENFMSKDFEHAINEIAEKAKEKYKKIIEDSNNSLKDAYKNIDKTTKWKGKKQAPEYALNKFLDVTSKKLNDNYNAFYDNLADKVIKDFYDQYGHNENTKEIYKTLKNLFSDSIEDFGKFILYPIKGGPYGKGFFSSINKLKWILTGACFGTYANKIFGIINDKKVVAQNLAKSSIDKLLHNKEIKSLSNKNDLLIESKKSIDTIVSHIIDWFATMDWEFIFDKQKTPSNMSLITYYGKKKPPRTGRTWFIILGGLKWVLNEDGFKRDVANKVEALSTQFSLNEKQKQTLKENIESSVNPIIKTYLTYFNDLAAKIKDSSDPNSILNLVDETLEK